MNELALFAGAGGGILGGKLLGWRTVCAVEWEAYPASVLCARQNDGFLPTFPVWDDVQTFDGRPWRGIVDVVSGGFPCQDISVAGNGNGLDGERSGMWKEMARIIGEVRPKFAFVENSPMLVSRGLERVLADFTSMGYDSRWGVISAADVGANHKRERIWIVAHSNGNFNIREKSRSNAIQERIQEQQGSQHSSTRESCGTNNVFRENSLQGYAKPDKRNLADSERLGWQKRPEKCGEPGNQKTSNISSNGSQAFGNYGSPDWWTTEPNVDRVVNGMASRVDRLKAIGNGQVPLCAATAWRILSGSI